MRVLQSIAVALVLAGSAYAQVFPFPGPMAAGGGGGGGTPPSGFSATTLTTTAGSGHTFTTGTFTVTAGQAVIVSIESRSYGADACATVSGITGGAGGTGDTWARIGEYMFPGGFSTCAGVWKMWTPTPSSTYSLLIQGSSSSPGSFAISVLKFTPGSIAGTVDVSCTGGSTASNNPVCSSALSPTGGLELGITASASFDTIISAASDDSTPSYTVLSGARTSDSNGGTMLSYYVGHPPPGNVTSGSWIGGGDAVSIASWMLK